MKADEIRRNGIANRNYLPAEQTGVVECLEEIAAQLAELNQNLRDIHPELNLPEECRKHQCDYYTDYLQGGEGMSHEAYHETAKRAEAHQKNCDSQGVCGHCQRYEQLLRA